MCNKSRLACLMAVAGACVSGAALAQSIDPVTTDNHSPDTIARRLPAPIYVDDMASLELANKLGLNNLRPGLRGLPGCDVINDLNNCYPADITLGANFSNGGAGNYRVMDNVTPATSNPTQICWIGRYANRVAPAVADEQFEIRIFNDAGGFPDLNNGPIFQRVFSSLSGTPGVNKLDYDCLDGDACPGTSDPVSGGHYVYSATVDAGFPMNGNGCYWIEITCIGSASVGVNWGWVASTQGNDLFSLQAIDGAYTLFTRVDYDRAICVSGGVRTGFGCEIAPMPPVCDNSDANGIPYDGTTPYGVRADFPGSVGGFQLAENISFNTNTTVTSICFGGFWLGFNDDGQAVAVAPPTDPQFRVAYFTNSSVAGVPGAPIAMAEFGIGDPGVTFQWDGDEVVKITHPPVELPGNACSWVSVGRVQAVQGIGQPIVPIWHWFLTTSSAPAADRRFASRSSGAVPGVWTPTTVTDGGPLGTSISNLWYLLSDGPVVGRTCQNPPCQITIPGGVTQENEPLCGLDPLGDLVNGGCNNLPENAPAFSQITCGQTYRGTVAFNGELRDTDWYQFTLTEEQVVTMSVNAEFFGFAGFVGVNGAPIVNLNCATAPEGMAITPAFEIGGCQEESLEMTLGPGTYTIIVVPAFGDQIACGDNTGSEYTLKLTCEGSGGPECPADWDGNGSVNSNDISAFLSAWLVSVQNGTLEADFDGSGSVNSNDISAFLSAWLQAVQQGC